MERVASWQAHGYKDFSRPRHRHLRLRIVPVLSANADQPSIDLNPGETKGGRGRTAIMISRAYELLKSCVIGKGADDYVLTLEAKPSLATIGLQLHASEKAGPAS